MVVAGAGGGATTAGAVDDVGGELVTGTPELGGGCASADDALPVGTLVAELDVVTLLAGLSCVVVGGGLGAAATMITKTATRAVIALRRRTDQSGRIHDSSKPIGKKKMRNSTTVTVRRYHGSVSGGPTARLGEMIVSSSSIHSGQPHGSGGQDGSGSQPGGGDQSSGGCGQFGGGLNLMYAPLGE